jgi:hypothetical protein
MELEDNLSLELVSKMKTSNLDTSLSVCQWLMQGLEQMEVNFSSQLPKLAGSMAATLSSAEFQREKM